MRFSTRLRQNKIRLLLIRQNMSQASFAQRCGIAESHLSELLCGKRFPSGIARQKILNGVREVESPTVNFDDLFEIVEKKQSDKEV